MLLDEVNMKVDNSYINFLPKENNIEIPDIKS